MNATTTADALDGLIQRYYPNEVHDTDAAVEELAKVLSRAADAGEVSDHAMKLGAALLNSGRAWGESSGSWETSVECAHESAEDLQPKADDEPTPDGGDDSEPDGSGADAESEADAGDGDDDDGALTILAEFADAKRLRDHLATLAARMDEYSVARLCDLASQYDASKKSFPTLMIMGK